MAQVLIADRRAELVKGEAPVFENVTGVETEVIDISKSAGEVKVVIEAEDYFADEPETPAEPVTPKRKRGKKHEKTNPEHND